ncbi:MAG TPA: S8 family serine peptidase [Candidatus Dormibacteraeota bacterium]|nr:S8 family serine peptidase [Candidatus Dormibacteraeota bacterium]
MGSLFRRLALAGASVLVLIPAGNGQAMAQGTVTIGQRYQSKLTLDDIARLSADATQRSIIIFKDQHANLPARGAMAGSRASTVANDQAPVRNELTQVHARNVKGFKVLNGISATISRAEANRLNTNPAVQAVVPDLPLRAGPAEAGQPAAAAASPAASLQQLCPPDPAVPLLEPEPLQLMNVEFQPGSGQAGAHDLVDGTGVKVAWMADGIDIDNPDFVRAGKSIFVDYQDFTAEGTNAPTNGAEAFGDASSIAAQGNVTYDLNRFVSPAHPLPPGCNVRVKGIAPGVSLVGLKVFGENTLALTSYFLQAIDWAVTVDKVDVINQSFGANPYPDRAQDPIALADTAATQAGVVVVASSGDAGTASTIGTPSDAPGVIGVGGTTSFRSYRQTTSFASQLSAGGWISDNISGLSSGGFTQFGPHTVDVVAPGDLGWAVCTANPALYSGCLNNVGQPSNIQLFGGTSQSSPLTAGTAALVIQAYEKSHGGVRPSAALVKQIIVSSATDLHVPGEEQGAGLVNALEAVQQAMSIQDSDGTPAAQGQSLLVSQTSLSATAPAGSSQTFHIQVTNTGTAAQTVRPAGWALDPTLDSNDTGTLNLNPATAPTFIDGSGISSGYVLHSFTVPAGVDRLDASVTWNGAAQPNSRVRETLFDPFGRLAAYTLPQGPGGFNHVDVHDPAAGTWTAVFWTRKNATVYSGDFQFSFTTQRFARFGSVAPASRTLAPGATGSFSVTVRLPAQPGDQGARLVLGTGSADDGSIPITLRSLVRLNSSGGSFQGVLTGGNGRPIFGGQVLSFQFDVPGGKKSLNLALNLRDPNYNLTGFLVDPQGEALDIQSTAPITGGGSVAFTNAMQFFQRTPQKGRWSAIFALNAPLTGQNLREPFTGAISFGAGAASATGLPHSASKVLPAGVPVTIPVQVTNNGNSQKAYFVDPRLNQRGALPLLGLNPTSVTVPIVGGEPQPAFLIPTDSDQLVIVANGSEPIQMDVNPNFGDPDIEGLSFANASVAVDTAPEVTPGAWFALPTQVGPFGATGSSPSVVDTAAAVDANLFDAAVTSDTGSLWLLAVDETAPFSPLILDPGQTGTITVTITPNAARGTVVRGALEVDTFNPNTLSGDEVIALPYVYRVG